MKMKNLITRIICYFRGHDFGDAVCITPSTLTYCRRCGLEPMTDDEYAAWNPDTPITRPRAKVDVYVQNNIGWDDHMQRKVIEAIRKATGNHDDTK